MRLISGVVIFFSFSLLLCTTSCFSYSDEPTLRRQFEEFRDDDATGDHRSLNNNEAQAEATLIYGRKALDSGEVEKAIDYFKSGLTQFPKDGRFSLMLGLGYTLLAENTQAELHLRDAIELLPDADEARQLLFKLYYQSGQLADAEQVLLELLERTPDDPGLKEQLQRIRIEINVEGKMDQDVDSIFTISFDGEVHADLANLAIESLQDAYTEQGSLLNHYPQERVQVILYTREDYDLTTGSPPWSAGRFDGKIRIPINRQSHSKNIFRAVLYHEYNHFLAQQMSAGRAPAWFYEGLAMVAEGSERERGLNHLLDAVAADLVLPFSTLEKSFSRLGHEEALLAYEQSYSFVNYLIQQFGWHTLRDLLFAFRRGLPVEETFSSVFSDFGLSFAALQREWRTGL